MVLPRLIHPVPVVIEQISKGTTIFDEDAREPIQAAARSSQETVQGQVKWGGDYTLEVQAGGAQEGAQGYVLFLCTDLDARGITLNQNDRLVKIGRQEVDVYVIKLRPVGHYPDQSGSSMVKAFFADRQPSRQTRGGYRG